MSILDELITWHKVTSNELDRYWKTHKKSPDLISFEKKCKDIQTTTLKVGDILHTILGIKK